ncbi:hypothetical protein F5884DRAFT_784542 [Xylogone sp. PMI_703]|nr:hypothetical protein F5884DRAFT_784542 [Xylogone sp. PMI_703]
MSLRKACAPCRSQKLRCNAKDAGMPCGRCLDRRIPSACVLTPRRRRRRNGEAVEVPDRDDHNEALVHGPSSILRLERATNSRPSGAVPRGQFHLQLYSELTSQQPSLGSNDLLDSQSPGQEIVAYHGSTDLVSILGELKGTSSRLVRVVVTDNQNDLPITPTRYTGQEDWQSKVYRHSIQGLGEAAIQFLSSEQVFDVPPKRVCDDLIKLYFDHCHHLTPVIDPIDFIRTYLTGDTSLFLLYAILANAIPFASLDVLSAVSFSDRFTAQRAFSNRASHAFNFNLERSNLRLVQGSMILTTAIPVHGCQHDTDYWLYNAIRIASTMGLYRRDATQCLNQKMQKLCRRIWWIIYSRESLHWILGIKDTRLQVEGGSTLLSPLAMDDWEDDDKVEEATHILPSVQAVHKQYMIQLCRLCELASRITSNLDKITTMDETISTWRNNLPADLLSTNHPCALVLLSTSYRIECIILRALCKRQYNVTDRLLTCLFELNAIFGRVVAYDLIQSTSLLFANTVSWTVAVYVELSVNTTLPCDQQDLVLGYIKTGLILLKRAKERWQNVESTLRLLQTIIARERLDRTAPIGVNVNDDSTNGAQDEATLTSFTQDFDIDDYLNGSLDFGMLDYSLGIDISN